MEYGLKGVFTNNEGTRHPTTVLDFPQKWRRQDQLHPTQKPVELIEFLIKMYCPENGIVLDNCIGSGTTAVAAIKTGRKYIGYEIDKTYYEIANERIRQLYTF